MSKFNYTYDVVGNIKTWRQEQAPDPAQSYELGYDLADQLTAATLKSTDPTPIVLKRYGYAFDPAGNRTAEQTDDAVVGASHNNRNQLLSTQPGGALLFRGTTNEPATVTVQGQTATTTAPPESRFEKTAQTTAPSTNVVVQATDPSGNTRTNTYQVSQAGATTSYTHDANGNLTGDGAKTYEWSAENRLTAVKQGPTTLASFVYDGLGRRQQKTAGGVTHTYVSDGSSVIEERVSTGQTLRYVEGPGIDQHLAMHDGAAVTYYLADHLGSVVQETSSAGAVTLTRKYDVWGNMVSSAGTAGWAFTGREWDPETGLAFYRARYVDPKLGRFISEDPMGFEAAPNFYAYVENDPVLLTDPFGLDVQVCTRQAEDLPYGVPHTLLYPTNRKQGVGPGTGKCWASGFGPKKPTLGWSTAGHVQDEAVCDEYGNPSPAYQCHTVSKSKCVETCVEIIVRMHKKDPPNYKPQAKRFGGFQCTDWTDSIMLLCRVDCDKKGQ